MRGHTNVSKSLRRVSLVQRARKHARCLMQLLVLLYQLSFWLIYPLGKTIILVIGESPTKFYKLPLWRTHFKPRFDLSMNSRHSFELFSGIPIFCSKPCMLWQYTKLLSLRKHCRNEFSLNEKYFSSVLMLRVLNFLMTVPDLLPNHSTHSYRNLTSWIIFSFKIYIIALTKFFFSIQIIKRGLLSKNWYYNFNWIRYWTYRTDSRPGYSNHKFVFLLYPEGFTKKN